jgi:hypothetical protein
MKETYQEVSYEDEEKPLIRPWKVQYIHRIKMECDCSRVKGQFVANTSKKQLDLEKKDVKRIDSQHSEECCYSAKVAVIVEASVRMAGNAARNMTRKYLMEIKPYVAEITRIITKKQAKKAKISIMKGKVRLTYYRDNKRMFKDVETGVKTEQEAKAQLYAYCGELDEDVDNPFDEDGN